MLHLFTQFFKGMSFIRRSKTFIKILGINLSILIILLFSPALLFHLYKIFKARSPLGINESTDKRAYYPTYANKKFSIQMLNELQNLSSKYRSFIGWRRKKVNLKYTNIKRTLINFHEPNNHGERGCVS